MYNKRKVYNKRKKVYNKRKMVYNKRKKVYNKRKKVYNKRKKVYPRKSNADTMTKVTMTEKTKCPRQMSCCSFFLIY